MKKMGKLKKEVKFKKPKPDEIGGKQAVATVDRKLNNKLKKK